MDTARMSTPPATSPWKNLLPPAMVGTNKKPLVLPALDGAVGALLAQVQAKASSSAQALLQAAGVLTVCERAGQRPIATASACTSPHGVAAADVAQAALQDSPLIDTVRWLLTDAPQRLQIDWLQHLAAAGWRLPPSLLPLALDAAQRASVLRPAVLAVLGERGRCLARHHRTWRYATENVSSADSTPLETRWQEGTLAQRLQLLRDERQSQPSAARERLQASLADLPAKERAELLAVLQTGLSVEDDALLTRLASQDRSRDVRHIARGLLVQLPDSAISQRAGARLAPYLSLQTDQRWVIAPPEAADPSWKDEGIEAARPAHDKLGERAWWLYQLARQVPLSWWPQHTGMAPDALLQWVHTNDWADAVVRAWWEVLRAAPISATTMAWCKAFLDHWPSKAMQDTPAAVLALLGGFAPLAAQAAGHYVPGVEGIQNASAPPPGFYYLGYLVHYDINSFRAPGTSSNLPGSNKGNVTALANRFVWMTGHKLLGADYGVEAIVPIVRTSLKVGAAGLYDRDTGVGDVYLGPLVLGWHGPQWDAVAAAGMWLDTGSTSSPAAAGHGYKSTMLTGGLTYYFDSEKTLSGAGLLRLERHGKMDDGFRHGNQLTLGSKK